jgi:hypothetical protein
MSDAVVGLSSITTRPILRRDDDGIRRLSTIMPSDDNANYE